MHKGLIVCCFLLFGFNYCWGQTSLPASITSHMTLHKAESPYSAEQSISISAGASLTIEAGVQFLWHLRVVSAILEG